MSMKLQIAYLIQLIIQLLIKSKVTVEIWPMKMKQLKIKAKENVEKYQKVRYNVAKTPKQKRLEAESKARYLQQLVEIQREQALKEIVSEHQLHAHSVQRMVYAEQTSLVPCKAQEAKAAKMKQLARFANEDTVDGQPARKKAYIPTITYNILNVLPFSFQGTALLLVLFESPIPCVKVFEAETGFFDSAFDFQNNVLDEFSAMEKCLRDPDKSATNQKKVLLQPRTKHYLSEAEVNYHKRKILRERGEYKPEIPALTAASKASLQRFTAAKSGRPRQQLSASSQGPATSGSNPPGGSQPVPPGQHRDTILSSSLIIDGSGAIDFRPQEARRRDDGLGAITESDVAREASTKSLMTLNNSNSFVANATARNQKKHPSSLIVVESADDNEAEQPDDLAEEMNREEPLNLTLDRSAQSKQQLLQQELGQVPEGATEGWQEEEPAEDAEEAETDNENEQEVPAPAGPPKFLHHDLWSEIEGDALQRYGRKFKAKQQKTLQSRHSRRHGSGPEREGHDCFDAPDQDQDAPPDRNEGKSVFDKNNKWRYARADATQARTRAHLKSHRQPLSIQIAKQGSAAGLLESSVKTARAPQNLDLNIGSPVARGLDSLLGSRALSGNREGQSHPHGTAGSAQPRKTVKLSSRQNKQGSAARSKEISDKTNKMKGWLKMEFATQLSGKTSAMPLWSQVLSSKAKAASRMPEQAQGPEGRAEAVSAGRMKLKIQHRFMDALTQAIIYKHNREVLESRKSLDLASGAAALPGCSRLKKHSSPDPNENKKYPDIPSSMHQTCPSLAELKAKFEAERVRRRAHRAAEQKKRAEKVKMIPYGFLGLDSIVPTELEAYKQKADTGGQDHSYGLDHALFTPTSQQRDVLNRYNEARARWDEVYEVQQEELAAKRGYAQAMKRDDNPLTNGLTELVGAMQTKTGKEPKKLSDRSKSKVNAEAEPKSTNPAEMRKERAKFMDVRANIIAEMNEEKRAVYNKMDELKSKHEEWGEWLSTQDERLMDGKRVIKELYEDEKLGILTQKELRKLKHDLAGKHRKDEADLQGGHPEAKDFERKAALTKANRFKMQPVPKSLAAVAQEWMPAQRATNDSSQARETLQSIQASNAQPKQERNRPQELEKHDQAVAAKPRRMRMPQEYKQTYPMCMGYYEPTNVAVFALVSKEIQLHQLKKTGLKRKFTHVQSLRVENMIVALSFEKHKSSNSLLLCLGTQSKLTFKKKNGETAHCSEIVVYKLDPRLEYEVLQSYRWPWPEEQVTTVFYRGGCGLIVTSCQGFIQIYDAINVDRSVWDNSQLMRQQRQTNPNSRGVGATSTVAFSEALDLIAYAGAQGKIHLLDQTTKSAKGSVDAHPAEILRLQFYDRQRQLISVCVNGAISLWDAQKLMRIQTIRNTPGITKHAITACSFYEPLGRILMATTKIFKYDLKVEEKLLVHTQQQNTIARDYLRSMAAELTAAGVLELQHSQQRDQDAGQEQEPDPEETQLSSRVQSPANPLMATIVATGRRPYKEMTEAEFLKKAYDDSSLQEKLPARKEFNSSVVPRHQLSQLIGCIIDIKEHVIYTIDGDLLVRLWNIGTGRCIRSFLIETREDLIAEAHQRDINEERQTGKNPIMKKAFVVCPDADREQMVIAFEGGELQVNNLKTGQLIYNNTDCEPIRFEHEVAQVKFFVAQTRFWFAASCWEGAVGFVTRPLTRQGRSYLQFKKCASSHKRDVISLDINSANQLATASVDNIICFWDTFNARESKQFALPGEIACQTRQQNIQYIRFPFKDKKDVLLIVMSGGQCYFLETQSEKFIKNPAKGSPSKQSRGGQPGWQQSLSPTDGIASSSDEDSFGRSRSGSPEISDSRAKIRVERERQPGRMLDLSSGSPIPGGSPARSSTRRDDRGPEGDHLVHGRVPRRSVLDLAGGYLLAVGDNGKGKLHSLRYVSTIGKDAVTRAQTSLPSVGGARRADAIAGGGSLSRQPSVDKKTASAQRCPIELEEIGRFEVLDPHDQERHPDNGAFQVDLCLDLGIFVVAQRQGQVSMFSLPDCQVLACLNQPHALPRFSMPRAQNGEDDDVLRSQERAQWPPRLTTRRGGYNTHRAPNGDEDLAQGVGIAAQRLGATVSNCATNRVLHQDESRASLFNKESSTASVRQPQTTTAPSQSGVFSPSSAAGMAMGSPNAQRAFSSIAASKHHSVNPQSDTASPSRR